MDALKQKHCSEKCALEEEKGVLLKQIADLEMALGVEKNRSEYVRKALQEALAECDWIEVSKTESFDSTLFVFVAVVHFSNYNFHLLHFRKRNDNSGLKETRWKSSCSFFKPLFYFYFESYSHDPYWKIMKNLCFASFWNLPSQIRLCLILLDKGADFPALSLFNRWDIEEHTINTCVFTFIEQIITWIKSLFTSSCLNWLWIEK